MSKIISKRLQLYLTVMIRRNHSQPWTFLCILCILCIVFSVLSGAPTFCKVRWRPRFELVQRTPVRAREIQPPEIAERRDGDPPVETGRNPQAVALDFIWGIVLIPVVILGMLSTYLFGGFLSTVSKPAPSVPLAEALSALTAIEDDYAVRGPSMGLRQRLANWFQWSEPQRRLDFELEDVQNRSARERIRKRGMDAAEDIASVVEYFIAGNGIIDDSGRKGSRFLWRELVPTSFPFCLVSKLLPTCLPLSLVTTWLAFCPPTCLPLLQHKANMFCMLSPIVSHLFYDLIFFSSKGLLFDCDPTELHCLPTFQFDSPAVSQLSLNCKILGFIVVQWTSIDQMSPTSIPFHTNFDFILLQMLDFAIPRDISSAPWWRTVLLYLIILKFLFTAHYLFLTTLHHTSSCDSMPSNLMVLHHLMPYTTSLYLIIPFLTSANFICSFVHTLLCLIILLTQIWLFLKSTPGTPSHFSSFHVIFLFHISA